MTQFEYNLRCQCREVIERNQQLLAVVGVCEGCCPDAFDRGEVLSALAHARRVLTSLDDPVSELRRLIDEGQVVPSHWLFQI
jgi:hypothetical protein